MAKFTSQLKWILRDKGTREKRDISYRAMAEETGLSVATIARMAKGEGVSFTSDTLLKICTYLHCQPGEVIGIDFPDTGSVIIGAQIGKGDTE